MIELNCCYNKNLTIKKELNYKKLGNLIVLYIMRVRIFLCFSATTLFMVAFSVQANQDAGITAVTIPTALTHGDESTLKTPSFCLDNR